MTSPEMHSLASEPDLHSVDEPWAGGRQAKGRHIQALYLKFQEELVRGVIKKFDVGRSEAEDVVQTAFTRYAEVTSTVENPRAFLYRSCSNIAIDQIRRRQVQLSYAQKVIDSEASRTEELGPEREVEGRQRLGIVSRALWAMPSKRRKLLIMHRFDGLSYAEIGRQVNLSESVVRKHISNALADCQKALQVQR